MFKKQLISVCLSVSLILSVAATNSLAADRYTLDPAHTTVAFLIDHVGYAKTLGLFTETSGSFSFDQASNTVSDIVIAVKTASVNTANEARDKHVRNKDFLNVSKYPEMTFFAESATIDENGIGKIEGLLTLLGQAKPLVLNVSLNKAEKYPFGHKRFTLGISANGDLLRSDYGMEYGVANALVGDTVSLMIETEAIQDK